MKLLICYRFFFYFFGGLVCFRLVFCLFPDYGFVSPSMAAEAPLIAKKDNSPIRIGVYSGEGAHPNSIKAAVKLFKWMDAEPQRITPQEILEDKLNHFDILYMTGGYAWPYVLDLKDGGTAIIRKFVRQGGSYIGVCAGAFFAADYIYWEGKRYEYPLDLFPGYAKGPIVEIAPWPRYKLCRINLSKKPHTIIKDEPSSMRSFYSGGPWFDIPPGFKADILAYYDINNRPAMLAYEYGKGRVFLAGVHPEYEEGSDRDGLYWNDKMKDPESEWPLMLNAVRWLIRQE